MLAKLGNAEGWSFTWDKRDRCYCWGGHMGYETLSDRGKWFSLDYLAK